MKALLIAVAVACFAALPVFADEQMSTAERIAHAQSSPTLKAWNAKERERLTPQNTGYRMHGPHDLCTVMRSVGIGCSYNERGNLVQYLYAQGVDLFPCEGGTNPYTRDMCDEVGGFYNFTGQPSQNVLLKKSIEKNRSLFRNGDLTASDAGRWRK